MSVQAAAQRKAFKGKYRGPERFKGDKAKIASWKAEKAKGNPNPDMASEPESYDEAGNVIPVASSTTVTAPAPVTSANRVFKGTYAGKDKYKGIAQKGKHKGKYIGLDSRKGMAKPPTLTEAVTAQATS